jgi:GDP-4-dehydro-6-deoxy-D-mannose reductase
MKALITGVNGFVGCHLSRLLVEKGYDVTGTRIDELNLDIVNRHVPLERVFKLDLRDREQVDGLIGMTRPEVVFHLAGQSWVPASWEDPAATFEVNLFGSIHVFESMIKHVPESRCIFISTGDFYESGSAEGAGADENARVMPRNPYALSKMASDLMAGQLFVSADLQVVRLRPFNHIGPYQSERFVVSEFARQIALAERDLVEPLIRVGNLDVERDFTDVRDIVRAYELAVEKCTPGECYNISSQKACSVRLILDMLLSESTLKIDVETDPEKYRPAEVKRFLGDSAKFRAATGWSPEIPTRTTLVDTLNHWREKVKNE